MNKKEVFMPDKFRLTNQHFIILIIVMLTIFILSAYWPVQKYDFINYDDTVYVTSNYSIQKKITFESIKSIFGHVHTGHWHPVTMMSHMLDWQLFGDKAGGHHWTNVIIHIFNTILLFLLFNKLTGAMWRSAFIAALFAIHPLNVESVAWISERKNVLSTFFLILTMFFYVWYVKNPNWKRYLPVFLCFALGLMSKPMLVTLPFILLLLDYWPLNRLQIYSTENDHLKIKEVIRRNSNKIFNLVLEKVPLFVLSAISVLLTLYAARYVGTVSSFESLPLRERISNAVVSYVLYIKKLFWPTDLAVFYPISAIPVWQFFIASLFLIIVTVFVCRYFRKYPYLFIGWFWYLGTLVPVIGLIQVGSQAMADRYAYVPLIGIFIIMAWGITDIARTKYLKNIVAIVSGISLIILFIITSFQIQYWRDTTSLFERAVNVTKNNFTAKFGLGNELLKRNKIDEAIKHYYESLILDPENDTILAAFAWALHMKGENDKAIDMLRLALRFNPKSMDAHNRLGVILFQEGHIDEAIIEYKKAIDLNNDELLPHRNLGNALVEKGKIDEAINEYREVLRINPQYAGAHDKIAMLLMSQNKNVEAIKHFKEAIKLSPTYADAHFHLAKILKREGFEAESSYHFQEAISINPEYKNYKKNNLQKKRNNISQ
jgi:tetratricopeptide (TPR) repeat protein